MVLSHVRLMTNNDTDGPIIDKSIIIDDVDGTIDYKIFGKSVDIQEIKILQNMNDLMSLHAVLLKFESMRVCEGVGPVEECLIQRDIAYRTSCNDWHHINCELTTKTKRCKHCTILKNTLLQKKARFKKRDQVKRVVGTINPIDLKKINALRKKLSVTRRMKNRSKIRIALLQDQLISKQNELANIQDETLEQKCVSLNIPKTMRNTLKEIITSAKTRGHRYSEEWIMLCMLMNIRSHGYYEFLRKNNVIPLPCTRTIRSYFTNINTKCGFDSNFLQLLKKSFASKKPMQRHGVLLLDEINLRKSISVCSKTLTYSGLVDFGDDGPQATSIEDQATHGLVLMFQPLADTYTQPVAVFASKNPVRGDELAKIAVKAIVLLEESGAIVHGIVSDGAATNTKMGKNLGIKSTINETRTWFTHPLDNDRRVFMFSDVPHLVKNVRNRLYNKKILRVCI